MTPGKEDRVTDGLGRVYERGRWRPARKGELSRAATLYTVYGECPHERTLRAMELAEPERFHSLLQQFRGALYLPERVPTEQLAAHDARLFFWRR